MHEPRNVSGLEQQQRPVNRFSPGASRRNCSPALLDFSPVRSILAEEIKKRWQEYTEELYKKELHGPDNHDGVVTDLEPDILECEVR